LLIVPVVMLVATLCVVLPVTSYGHARTGSAAALASLVLGAVAAAYLFLLNLVGL
jgi:hypothetical protein